MTTYTKRPIPVDPNSHPVVDEDYAFVAKKTITFDGGTDDAVGDQDGSSNPFTIFTVSGSVKLRIFAVCTTNLAGDTATLEVGTNNSSAAIIEQTTGTDIDSGDIWHDSSPDTDVEESSVLSEYIVANSSNIEGNVGTDDITAGVIDFYCFWYPITEDGDVTAA